MHAFSYKMPPQTVEEQVYDERTGLKKKRYINKARHYGFSLQMLGHGHPPGKVPMEPEPAVAERVPALDQNILTKLKKVRPSRGTRLTPALGGTSDVDEMGLTLSFHRRRAEHDRNV